MDRKATARETLAIMDRGYYEVNGTRVDIREQQEDSVKRSFLLTPEQGEQILKKWETGSKTEKKAAVLTTLNCSAVDAILRLTSEGKSAAVLNFASAKNPGGGFINGAMAQEESLAASGCLYKTQLAHEEYYEKNRAFRSMMYTDHAIWSPDVVFFRDGRFRLMEKPVTASVLTLPAVNMGQVLLKGEEEAEAEKINRAKAAGGRIICVGTTSCRTLESATGEDGILRAGSGWTDIFIYPGYRFKILDCLITNFHLPESTLVMLVSALAGREHVLHAYEEAIREKYRFFSFGDACFLADLKMRSEE